MLLLSNFAAGMCGVIGVLFFTSIKPKSLRYVQILTWILCGISLALCISILILVKKIGNA